MEFTCILVCNAIHRLPRSTLRGTALKKGKPNNRRISEVYHYQTSTSLVQKTTNPLSFLQGLKRAVQN